MQITPFIYQSLWFLLMPFIQLYLMIRIRQQKEDKSRIQERFGRGYKSARPNGKLIWLHSVSLGESNAAINLITSLSEIRPDWHFLATTNTITAANHIEKNCASMPVTHVYQPLDHPFWVSRFLHYWHPDGAIFLESDFWFNLITLSKKSQIPVIFASSQISQTAKNRWTKNPSLAKKIFSSPSLILSIDSQQEEGFKKLMGLASNDHAPNKSPNNSPDNYSDNSPGNSLGNSPDNYPGNSHQDNQIFITLGSLKNRISENVINTDYENKLMEHASTFKRKIILAASTHEQEEELIAHSLKGLLDPVKHLLIFAPRHMHRTSEILNQLGWMPCRSKDELPEPALPYFMSDSLGEMTSLYNVSDVVICGGSFYNAGGHNPIEPALAGKPIICGESIFKNKADFIQLIEAGMIYQVRTPDMMRQVLAELLHLNSSQKDCVIKGQKIAQETCMRPLKAAHYIISTIEQSS